MEAVGADDDDGDDADCVWDNEGDDYDDESAAASKRN